MLDMGFIRDVRRIVAMLPRTRQSMLFSATMPGDIVKLVGDMLKAPERVEVAPPSQPIERIDQHVMFVATQDKRAALGRLLQDPAFKRVIVFTRTKHGANKVAEVLGKSGFSAERDPRQQVAERAPASRSSASATARPRSWSPPTSPRAASISTTSPMSSISSCRTSRKAMSTASAAPRAPAPAASPSRWSIRPNRAISSRSNG